MAALSTRTSTLCRRFTHYPLSLARPPSRWIHIHIRTLQAKMAAQERYEGWSKASLISRIAELEGVVPPKDKKKNKNKDKGKKEQGQGPPRVRVFRFADHPCRKVALRFSYDGAGYSGLAAQNVAPGSAGASSLPTVEAVLWDALCTARLVDPETGMDGAGWSRCGRTDRGVSAAGQVVALWMRSRVVDQWASRHTPTLPYSAGPEQVRASKLVGAGTGAGTGADEQELPYVQMLNRILPPSIRVQAWSPVRADFSARFDCLYRHYKYFFPLGAPALLRSGAGARLDIAAMREAATHLLGEHDFRNLCKLDASKQITNFRRRIDGVSIDRVSSGWPTSRPCARTEPEPEPEPEPDESEPMYVLNLRGTAFLYHQVRNIVAVLFLVGAGLERPSVMAELMNVERGAVAADRVALGLARSELKWWVPANGEGEGNSEPKTDAEAEAPMWVQVTPARVECGEVYATKPNYEMASDRPLVLWECGFRGADVGWRAESAAATQADLHQQWTQAAVRAELARHFVLAAPCAHTRLPAATRFSHAAFPALPPGQAPWPSPWPSPSLALIPLGYGTARGAATYLPLARRPREESYADKNRRWLETTGKRRAQRTTQPCAPDPDPDAHE